MNKIITKNFILKIIIILEISLINIMLINLITKTVIKPDNNSFKDKIITLINNII